MEKKRLGIVDQDDRDHLMHEAPALLNAAKFLKKRTVNQACDSAAVSDCVRCKTHFLADRVLYALQQDMGVSATE